MDKEIKVDHQTKYFTAWVDPAASGRWKFMHHELKPFFSQTYDERFSHIAVWDHILSKEEVDRIQNGHYPWNVPGLLVYIANDKEAGKEPEIMKQVQPMCEFICCRCGYEWIGTGLVQRCTKCLNTCYAVKDAEEKPMYRLRCTCGHEWVAYALNDQCKKCKGVGEVTEIPTETPLAVQVAGSHYKDMKIQPVEFIHANNIPFIEASCVKYLCRWRKKGGVEDLKKVIHFVEMLIELEGRNDG